MDANVRSARMCRTARRLSTRTVGSCRRETDTLPATACAHTAARAGSLSPPSARQLRTRMHTHRRFFEGCKGLQTNRPFALSLHENCQQERCSSASRQCASPLDSGVHERNILALPRSHATGRLRYMHQQRLVHGKESTPSILAPRPPPPPPLPSHECSGPWHPHLGHSDTLESPSLLMPPARSFACPSLFTFSLSHPRAAVFPRPPPAGGPRASATHARALRHPRSLARAWAMVVTHGPARARPGDPWCRPSTHRSLHYRSTVYPCGVGNKFTKRIRLLPKTLDSQAGAGFQNPCLPL